MRIDNRRRHVILTGVTCVCGLMVVLTALLVGYALVKFANFAAPALMPLLCGLFLAVLCQRPFNLVRVGVRRLAIHAAQGLQTLRIPHLPRLLLRTVEVFSVDTIVALALLVGLMALPLLLVYHMLVPSVAGLIEHAPTALAKAVLLVNTHFPDLEEILSNFVAGHGGLDDNVVGLVNKYGMHGARAMTGFLAYVSGLQSLLFLFAFFFIFICSRNLDMQLQEVNLKERVDAALPFLRAPARDFLTRTLYKFSRIMVGYFRTQVFIDLCEGVGFGLVLHFVMPYGFALGFMFGFLNLIPVIGTLVCLPFLLAVAYFGDGGSGMRLLCVCGLIGVLQLIDQVVTTKLQGKLSNLSTACVVFAYIFWGLVFQSFVGVLLAIPLTAFCKALWEELPRDVV